MTKNLFPNGVGAKPLKTLSVLQVADGGADNSTITQNLSGHKNAFSKQFWNLKEWLRHTSTHFQFGVGIHTPQAQNKGLQEGSQW